MTTPRTLIRSRFDRIGVALSALCAVHCVSGLVLATFLGLGGGMLLDPRIHEWGLAAAIGVGLFGLGFGALRHRQIGALVTGAIGLALMALALAVSHGAGEAVLTIAGVALVALAHLHNLRHAA